MATADQEVETSKVVDHIEAYQTLLRTANRLRRQVRKLYDEHGLTGAQYRLLARIPPTGITLTQLAKTARVDPGNTSGVVDRLEDEGWVRRTRSTEDRRVVKVMLSDKGIALLSEITPRYNAAVKQMMKVLADEELTTLVELLSKLDMAAPEASK